MNRLKEFLQVEVRRSYRQVITAKASLDTIKICSEDLALFNIDETFDINFESAEFVIDEIIELMEKYLKMDF